jgi:hypothetical protein
VEVGGEKFDPDGFAGDGGGGEVVADGGEGAKLDGTEFFADFAEEALFRGFARLFDAAGEDEQGSGVFFAAEEDAVVAKGEQAGFFVVGHGRGLSILDPWGRQDGLQDYFRRSPGGA